MCGGVRCAVVCGVRCAVCGVQCAVWLCWGGRSVVSVSGSYCGRCGCTQIAGGERRAAVRVRASVVGGRWVIGGVVVGGDWWVVIGVWLVVGVMENARWAVGCGRWVVGGGRWAVGGGVHPSPTPDQGRGVGRVVLGLDHDVVEEHLALSGRRSPAGGEPAVRLRAAPR